MPTGELSETAARVASPPPRVVATLILASIGAFVTSLDVVVVATALTAHNDGYI